MGVASKISQQSRDPRHPVESAQGGRPVDPRKSTLARPSSAGIQRRVPPSFRVTTGLPRVAVAGLAAAAALLGLAGCMNAAAKADLAGAIVIAATATANEPAPALSSANVALLAAAGESVTSAVAYIVNPANGQPAQLPLTPKRADGQVEYGPRRSQLLAQNLSRIGSQIAPGRLKHPVDLVNVAARDAERLVVFADRVLVRPFEQAVDLAVGVVVKLDLPDAELVGGALPCSLRDLVDAFGGKLQVIVEVHEPRHVVVPSMPATLPLGSDDNHSGTAPRSSEGWRQVRPLRPPLGPDQPSRLKDLIERDHRHHQARRPSRGPRGRPVTRRNVR